MVAGRGGGGVGDGTGPMMTGASEGAWADVGIEGRGGVRFVLRGYGYVVGWSGPGGTDEIAFRFNQGLRVEANVS